MLVIERTSQSNGVENKTFEFDYTTVPSSVMKFLKVQATRIRQYTGKTIVQIGKDLISAKRYLSHGQFLHWVESEVGIPARTAQAYMQAAQWASNHRASATLLPPSVLYILSSPTTPTGFAEEILRRVEAGEHLSSVAVRAELKSVRNSLRTDDTRAPNAEVMQSPAASDQSESDGGADHAISELVAILENALSSEDLSRVCAILTSNEVLEHPGLHSTIKEKFLNLRASDSESSGNSQEPSFQSEPRKMAS
jgi:hypothetical protein